MATPISQGPVPTVQDWLRQLSFSNGSAQYSHRVLKEDPAVRAAILAVLKKYFDDAHEDARRRIRKAAGISLDPLGVPDPRDPSTDYPTKLPKTTLQGYLGEILAGLVIETYGPCSLGGWEVPAHFCRHHNIAFQYLEKLRAGARPMRAIPGRTGNDCAAFRRDAAGAIVAFLHCEAKCTLQHNRALLNHAYEQVGNGGPKPESMMELIEVLEEKGGAGADGWVAALRVLWLSDPPPAGYQRYDAIHYVCGQVPVRDASWVVGSTPDPRYTGARHLEVIEVHLDDVESLLTTLYT